MIIEEYKLACKRGYEECSKDLETLPLSECVEKLMGMTKFTNMMKDGRHKHYFAVGYNDRLKEEKRK
jgi:hypothetical protein